MGMARSTLRESIYRMRNIEIGEWKRLCGRTYEQFMADIKQASHDERAIIELYAIYVKETFGIELVIEDNGCDNTGGFLEIDEVNKNADFIVNGMLVEVKTIEKKYSSFRLRLYAINAYIEQKASMLLVYGWKTENPLFTIVTPKVMKRWVRTKMVFLAKDWENKQVMKFSPDEFNWKPLMLNKIELQTANQ
jgi:hypothetical protein